MISYRRYFVAVNVSLLLVPFIFQSIQIKSSYALCALPDVDLIYSGIWHTKDNPGNYIFSQMDSGELNTNIDKLSKQGFSMTDIEPYQSNGKDWFAGIWIKDHGINHIVYQMDLEQLGTNIEKFGKDGYVMRDIEPYVDKSGNMLWAGIWSNIAVGTHILYEQDLQSLMTHVDDFGKAGYHMRDIETYRDKTGNRLWAGIWSEGRNAPAHDVVQYEMDKQKMDASVNRLGFNGYVTIDLETYMDKTGKRLWAGVWSLAGLGSHVLPQINTDELKSNVDKYSKNNVMIDIEPFEPRAAGEAGDIRDVPCEDVIKNPVYD